jgi:hypothetical protein
MRIASETVVHVLQAKIKRGRGADGMRALKGNHTPAQGSKLGRTRNARAALTANREIPSPAAVQKRC